MIVPGTLPPDWSKFSDQGLHGMPNGWMSRASVPINRILNNLLLAANGNIEFGSPQNGPVNIRGAWVVATTPVAADTQFTVTHNLGYIPTGFNLFRIDKPGTVYASDVEVALWTTQVLVLKCSASSAKITIFVV